MLRRIGPAAILCRGSFFATRRRCATSKKDGDSSAANTIKSKYDVLLKELEEQNKLVAELTTESLYKAAACENLRKEMREAKKIAESQATESFAKDMLEVLDALQVVARQAEEYLRQNTSLPPSQVSILAGIKLTEEFAIKALKRYGVSKICTAVGHPFDGKLEEKLYSVPSTVELKDGSVAEVVKSGYLLNGSVLRKAQVAVSEGL
ncbi:putative mitochondrial Co-chaperone, GrpE [Leptomonas pyrrhocoris]|uniref:Putative mitochondrial Co-chaperone, GrpE n=1 Tax=Leptomonas pyrrhocoris TaxID=157538 RepID=A0A0M9G604_LEPPY|nr:putative mitochondrial Co-chaperone, GrpE [Leptomonas pyrrhocoris]KPA83067.1 putative mitochondrial Co-chaperone, GrpE [Leptomonas pyrrhocoris]|eukprot:XP_015661506.1 putative mitochondrial Co-chaperone, GrpE [Leptomonas pyrrhocoris]